VVACVLYELAQEEEVALRRREQAMSRPGIERRAEYGLEQLADAGFVEAAELEPSRVLVLPQSGDRFGDSFATANGGEDAGAGLRGEEDDARRCLVEEMGVVDREDDAVEIDVAREGAQRPREGGEGRAGIHVAREHAGEGAQRHGAQRLRGRHAHDSVRVGVDAADGGGEEARLPNAAFTDEDGTPGIGLDPRQFRVAPDKRPTALGGLPAHDGRVGALLRAAQEPTK
jgi:hypothetical protein